jgi:hypothetical protein
MSRQSVIASGFAFNPVGDSARKADSGRVYSSLLAARGARLGLAPGLFGSDRLEIWTCTVQFRDGFQYVKLLEFVE